MLLKKEKKYKNMERIYQNPYVNKKNYTYLFINNFNNKLDKNLLYQ